VSVKVAFVLGHSFSASLAQRSDDREPPSAA